MSLASLVSVLLDDAPIATAFCSLCELEFVPREIAGPPSAQVLTFDEQNLRIAERVAVGLGLSLQEQWSDKGEPMPSFIAEKVRGTLGERCRGAYSVETSATTVEGVREEASADGWLG